MLEQVILDQTHGCATGRSVLRNDPQVNAPERRSGVNADHCCDRTGGECGHCSALPKWL